MQGVRALREHQGERTLDRVLEVVEEHAKGQISTGKFIAESEDLEIPVSKDDPSYGARALFTFLRHELLNAELRDADAKERTARIERVVYRLLQDSGDLAAALACGFATQAEGLERVLLEVELTRDDLADLASNLQGRLDALDARLEHAPPLAMPSAGRVAGMARGEIESAADRFHYSTEQVPLFGREDLLQELETFRTADSLFAWWLLTGPGGSGKSRLAFQTCREARNAGWWAGFLSHDHGPSGGYDGWHEWTPRRPTLAVIDYVAARHERVAAWLTSLAERAECFEHPVRVLLLERSANETDPWFQSLVGGPSGGAAGRRRDCLHEAPLGLPPLDPESLWRTMMHVWDASGYQPYPSRDSTLEALSEIDQEGRPLFAAFFAEAIAEGLGPDGMWNPQSLTEAILAQEVDRWRAVGFDGKHANLLALATMAGPIEAEQLDALTDPAGPALPIPALDDYNENELRRMNGFAAPTEVDAAVPFEPDVLGECFVLQRLAGKLWVSEGSAASTQRDVVKLAKWAWETRPEETAAFTARSFRDFPTGPENVDGGASALSLLTGLNSLPCELSEAAVVTSLCIPFVHVRLGEAASDAWVDRLTQLSNGDPLVAAALTTRGAVREEMKPPEAEEADSDYTRALSLPGATPAQKSHARYQRTLARQRLRTAALTHLERNWGVVICAPEGLLPVQIATAYASRAAVRIDLRQWGPAKEDFDESVRRSRNISEDLFATALMNRARGHLRSEPPNFSLAMKDFTSVAEELINASEELRSCAYFNRAVLFEQAGDVESAILGYSFVLEELSAPPVEDLVKCSVNRGLLLVAKGFTKDGLRDLAFAILQSEECGMEGVGKRLAPVLEELGLSSPA
ncbi:hypothetical protein LzC2_32270 [Planctomycetes bacterium LzC2]|uniref:ATP-binding protein n=1 Tax=Alienimonas chondri TaxID=2681879 RepID=A0ABX1VIM7_9PLAN|nr:hypothetical protein [Alienimonas chondri]